MKLPGPDHPIAIAPHPGRVRVLFAGRVIADSRRALSLSETTYKPVLYVPREDVDMTVLERSRHVTHCPYKGDASYYSIRIGERASENAIWTYEDAYPAMQAISGMMAFYPRRVDAIETSQE